MVLHASECGIWLETIATCTKRKQENFFFFDVLLENRDSHTHTERMEMNDTKSSIKFQEIPNLIIFSSRFRAVSSIHSHSFPYFFVWCKCQKFMFNPHIIWNERRQIRNCHFCVRIRGEEKKELRTICCLDQI